MGPVCCLKESSGRDASDSRRDYRQANKKPLEHAGRPGGDLGSGRNHWDDRAAVLSCSGYSVTICRAAYTLWTLADMLP
jgi:hypothetical protein